MKEESLLNVLLCLVTNHLAEKSDNEQAKIKAELEEAGISLRRLVKLIGWLKNLLQGIDATAVPKKVLRVFSDEECEKIDMIARGCILFLEQTGAVTPDIREWLIEQAMALEVETVGFEELKCLLLLVLFKQFKQTNLLDSQKSLLIVNPRVMH